MGEFIRNRETQKVELHFEKSEYMELSDEMKQKIKGAFLWGSHSGCWISRGKNGSWSYNNAVQIAKELGLEDGGRVGETRTFEEQMEVKKVKAEHRADRYDYKSSKHSAEGERLQKPINDMHGDIAFFTQPNINTSSGRAFTNRRNQMFSMYERGFEEFKKSAYYDEMAEKARQTASGTKPTDKAFCERRIKEAEKNARDCKGTVKFYEELIEKIEKGEEVKKNPWKDEYYTSDDLDDLRDRLEDIEDRLEGYISKAIYYHECLDELGGIQFSKDNLKIGYIVRVNRYGLVQVTSLGKVNFKGMTLDDGWNWSWSYAEIKELVKAEEQTEIKHPFKVGDEYTVEVWTSEYDENGRYINGDYKPKTYKVTKVTVDKVTLKCGNERAITRKVRYNRYNANSAGWTLPIADGRNGYVYKEDKKEEKEAVV